MDLDLTPNYSFFIQLITFVVLWQGLKRLVFEPFLRVLDEREKRTVAAKAEAERLLVEVERTRGEYEQALHRIRVEMAQEAASARNAAQEEGQRALAAARAAANEDLMRMRTQVAAQVDAARSSLATQAEAIAQEMLARVVNGKAA